MKTLAGAKRSGRDTVAVRADEAERIVASLAADSHTVALDPRGTALDSEGLSKNVNRWLSHGRDVNFVIGGADGLADEFIESADFVWSLSPLTFPHHLCQVIVVEQIYRASTILSGHPYHSGH